MADVSLFDKIRIGIASSEDILGWSSGEVKKPETINYRTFKPERDGLFCERIFGPQKDYECSCGRYKKHKYNGFTCERCGVTVTRSKVRRERMGHIELAAPVCHIWYLRGVPSPLALLLDITAKHLEKVVYFGSFIIIDIDREEVNRLIPDIRGAVELEKLAIQKEMQDEEHNSVKRFITEINQNPEDYDKTFVRERAKAINDRIKAEFRDADDRLKDLDIAVEILDGLEKNKLIEEDKYRAVMKLLHAVGDRLNKDLTQLLNANIGAEAVKELLGRVDLEKLSRSLRNEIVSNTGQKRSRAIKRLEITEALISSKSKPEWMILDVVPVISPDLRPMVQLDGGRFATSDLNDLYRRIINRNNRLKKIIEIMAPESIINHEKRLLQESVDSLIDNSRRARPVVGSNQRQLKSLSDMLKGKEGRFRKNLLGKRVDYSGRSVIVVGPHLKLHQCGLPKDMALELFKPFVMKTLVEKKITHNIKTAKRMIERQHPDVWDGLEEVIREHPVLLNRAPTLHRLGIQAFEPILVDGKAIQVHPLVCSMYNADFDGDQMAVHVPLSIMAQSEARILMLSTQNLFSPGDGAPTCAPVQDIILGAYALTMESDEERAKFDAREAAHAANPEAEPGNFIYANVDEVIFNLETPASGKRLHLNFPVNVRIRRPVFRPNDEISYRDPINGREYLDVPMEGEENEGETERTLLDQEFENVVRSATPGQLLLNEILPYPLRYSDEFLTMKLNKKALSNLIRAVHAQAGVGATIKFLDDLKDIGFKWATRYGISVAITDMDPPSEREQMLQEAEKQSQLITTSFRRGSSNYNEFTKNLVNLWTDTYTRMGNAISDGLTQFNPLSIITVSGARGSIKQLAQLAGMRGLMFNQFNEVIYELPVKNSFHIGLNMLEFFATTHGARKGLADTALRTADAGYLTRRLCDVAQDVIINAIDCGTTEGIQAHRLTQDGKRTESVQERVFGRVSRATITNPATGEVIIEEGEVFSEVQSKAVNRVEETYFDDYQSADEAGRTKLAEQYVACGFDIDDHGLLGVAIRSPLTCELHQGICSKCYGVDLSTQRLVDIGLSVGIIAAQSIGEPGTQLTMRTFHTGGVAGSATIARTNQYKTGKFVRQFMQDFESATSTDHKTFDPSKLLESQEAAVRSMFADAATAPLTINEEEPKEKTAKQTKAHLKALEKADSESRKMWERSRKTFFYAWTGESSGIVRVEEIFEARKQPRGKAIICPVTGIVKGMNDTSYGRWVIIEAVVPAKSPLKEAYIADNQTWPVEEGKKGDALDKLIGQKLTSAVCNSLVRHGATEVRVLYPVLVPPLGTLPISKGSKVIKGDPLTKGPRDPHEVLELAGAAAVYDYFIDNLQGVYKNQGVDINDKHIEVIIRQMLRKRTIREPGDARFLPGQVVDRFTFAKANEAIRARINTGEKITYTDPVSGQEVTRDPKESSADWILLGITEASLATDSFLSAASFQKTTKVLTEAAVRGKKDHLVGLKENVIIGRLIPSGTGVKQYRDVSIEVQRGPAWMDQSLTDLVEAETFDPEELDVLTFATLEEMASQADDLGDEE